MDFEKPGAGEGPKDRRTHYNNPYDRKSREVRTIQKKFWGLDALSKKEKLLLESSTRDGMDHSVCYSLNKSKRWELGSSPEAIIERMASESQAYPIAAIDQSIMKGEYTCNALSQKIGSDAEIKSVKVKSGNGGPFLSLRDSVTEKPFTSSNSTEKKKRVKNESAKEYIETPSILYSLEYHHSDELYFRRLIGKSKYYGYTSRKVKNVNFEDDNDEIADNDSHENEEEGEVEREAEESPKTSTLADFIVSTKLSKNKENKRRKNDDFEMINEIPKAKAAPKTPSLSHISELASSSISCTRFINIDTEYLPLPNFDKFEFMFDFLWLNREKTKCLFVIPKGCEDSRANFNSTITLELSETQKHPLLKMTVKSVHEVYLPPTSGNPQRALNEVEFAIRKLWNQGIDFLNKPKGMTSNSSYQPQTSIFSTFNPMGDYALLGLKNEVVSATDADDYENVESEGCDICSHSRDSNLTTLKCGHTFCRFCSEKFIREQIFEGRQLLSCAKCTSQLEPYFLLTSTPILLLQAYLRFRFLQQENTFECPNKCGVAFVEENPKFGGVQCVQCKVAFCVKCKQEPHFPLTCDQFKYWESRFLPQYIAETNPSETVEETPEEKSFWEVYGPLQWHYYRPYHKKSQETPKPMKVTSSIASICIEARCKRVNRRYSKKTIKQFDAKDNAKELRHDLMTILHLLEYGFAWVYFSRKYNSLEYKSIKQVMYNLKAAFVEMESRLSTGDIQAATEKLNFCKNLSKILSEKF